MNLDVTSVWKIMNVYILLVFYAIAGVCAAPEPDHHHHCHDVPKDEAVVIIQHCYSDHMCKEITDHLDCWEVRQHLPPHLQAIPDRQMCGPSGITYPNHCHFVKALCYRVLNHFGGRDGEHFLSMSHEGPCVTPAPTQLQASVTPIVAGTPAAVNITTTTATTSTSAQSSSNSVSSAATPTPTVAVTASTALPAHDVIQQFFCGNLQAFDCMASGINPVCGTDGQVYPNECSLQKAKCINNAISHTDFNNCSVNP